MRSDSDDQKKGLIFSLAAHGVLFLFLIIKGVLLNSDPIDYQSAIRVDMVALPDKIPDIPESSTNPPDTPKPIEPDKPVATETPPKTEALPKKDPLIDDQAIKLTKDHKIEELKKQKLEEQKKKEALDKIKKMSALEKIKSSVETDRIEKLVGQSETKKPTFKGNVLNSGTELSGINKIQHENYVALIDRQIKENWTLPQWLAKKDFKAQVLLRVDENGQITYNEIYKTSGNSNYDDIVVETVRKSGPFPKPPEKFLAIMSEKGVLIGFPE